MSTVRRFTRGEAPRLASQEVINKSRTGPSLAATNSTAPWGRRWLLGGGDRGSVAGDRRIAGKGRRGGVEAPSGELASGRGPTGSSPRGRGRRPGREAQRQVGIRSWWRQRGSEPMVHLQRVSPVDGFISSRD